VSYKEKIINLLETNMTEKGFKLWNGINSILPDTWERPTSSTGKYHKKADGSIPTQGEHVYQLLYSTVKVWRMFDIMPKTSEADVLLFAIVLHDSLKYGKFGAREHSDIQHDKNAGDMVKQNKETFLKVLNEKQFVAMEEAIRFHSGRWSTDVTKKEFFDWDDFKKYTFFIHMLDMLSTADCLQTDMRS